MNPLVAFLCFLALLLVVGKVVSKITGSKAYYLETLPLAEGERVLWEDLAADAYPIPARRALIVTYRRSRRSAVRVTTLRIIAGSKALFSTKHMVTHMLYPSDRAYPEAARSIGGGLLTVGYQTLVFHRAAVELKATEEPAFADLSLDGTLASSMNLTRYRIYSDAIRTFCLPE